MKDLKNELGDFAKWLRFLQSPPMNLDIEAMTQEGLVALVDEYLNKWHAKTPTVYSIDAAITGVTRKDDSFVDNDGRRWHMATVLLQLSGWRTSFLLPVPAGEEEPLRRAAEERTTVTLRVEVKK